MLNVAGKVLPNYEDMASWLLVPLNTLSNGQRAFREFFVFSIANDGQDKTVKAMLKWTKHLLVDKGFDLQHADIDLRDVLQTWLDKRQQKKLSLAKKSPSKKIKKVRRVPKQKSMGGRYPKPLEDEMGCDSD